MIKTDYQIKTKDSISVIYKDGKMVAKCVMGEVSALEAIFVMEKMTKTKWLVCKDGDVFLTTRV